MKCPGQDSRYWTGDAIYEAKCPECGHVEEFFKDESTRKCKICKQKIVNPRMDFGCATYCKYAEQCLGELPVEILAERENLLKDRVGMEMKLYFAGDFKRIEHANKVAEYAKKIVIEEEGDIAVVVSASYLHDIGIKEAYRKHQSTAARYQEEEGPPIARKILAKLCANPELIDEVCDIVGHHHHPRKEETTNFKSLYDADQIVNIEDELKIKPLDSEKLSRIIEKRFLTKTGRQVAREALIKQVSKEAQTI